MFQNQHEHSLTTTLISAVVPYNLVQSSLIYDEIYRLIFVVVFYIIHSFIPFPVNLLLQIYNRYIFSSPSYFLGLGTCNKIESVEIYFESFPRRGRCSVRN